MQQKLHIARASESSRGAVLSSQEQAQSAQGTLMLKGIKTIATLVFHAATGILVFASAATADTYTFKIPPNNYYTIDGQLHQGGIGGTFTVNFTYYPAGADGVVPAPTATVTAASFSGAVIGNSYQSIPPGGSQYPNQV